MDTITAGAKLCVVYTAGVVNLGTCIVMSISSQQHSFFRFTDIISHVQSHSHLLLATMLKL
jgi:hypothetical protein